VEVGDWALLLLRVTVGVTLAAHGYNKFFGGGRIAGTARWFESIGMRPGRRHAILAASGEIAAGLALVRYCVAGTGRCVPWRCCW